MSSAGSNVSSDHHSRTYHQMGSSGGSVGEVEEEEEEEEGEGEGCRRPHHRHH